jgi:septum formation protein
MSLWRADRPLILASQSAARQALLRNAGLAFDAIPADLDERAVQAAAKLTAPREIAALLAREKALNVARAQVGCWVIGADQTLALDDRLFNKPADRAAAATQLAALAGRTHRLYSAVAVARDGAVAFETVTVATLAMRALSSEEISAYLDAAGDAVTGSVGAYQLERLGIHLFERIDGDHFTILGLPLLPLLGFFRQHGLLAL